MNCTHCQSGLGTWYPIKYKGNTYYKHECGHVYGDYINRKYHPRKVKTQGKVLIIGIILIAWFFVSLVCVTLS